MMPTLDVRIGDSRDVLKTLPDESVHCIVTSPPYWGLRDYGHADQIGLEPTPLLYVQSIAAVFHEAKRVLRKDGTLWLNLGDCYAGAPGGYQGKQGERASRTRTARIDLRKTGANLKPKDLVGIPWRVAFALQDDGWFLRSDIIWAKPNPTPESCTDRPTKSHEHIFLLTKSARYYYDADAIAEPVSEAMMKQVREGYNGQSLAGFEAAGAQNPSDTKRRIIEGARKKLPAGWDSTTGDGRHGTFHKEGRADTSKWGAQGKDEGNRRLSENVAAARANGGAHDSPFGLTRNKRDVWTVTTSPYDGAHFATYPAELIVPCVLAGCPIGGTVLDPFGGSGTTGQVALEHGRNAILIELNPANAPLIAERTAVTPAFL